MGLHANLARVSMVLPTRAPRAAVAPTRVVIVGNGMVSHGLCVALTSNQRASLQVTVLGAEPYPAYDRIHLSEIRSPESALLAPHAWYRRHGIDLRLGTAVVGIDRAQRRVLLEGGEAVEYDTLVLATGAEPVRPQLSGVEHARVFAYRTIDDVRRIREALVAATSAVVVGGGLLGLEAAQMSRSAGCATTVVEASRMLMPRQLDRQSAEILRSQVEALGVHVKLAAQLQAVDEDAGRLRLRFDNGDVLHTDVVVMAIGVRPRDHLAREAGLAVAARGGVIVDDRMRTLDPSIYAIGDCACHRGHSYGLIAPGLAMADVVANAIAGGRSRFVAGDRSCELKLMGIPVAAVGDYESANHERGSRTLSVLADGGRRTLLLDSRRVLGAVVVGEWHELPRVRALSARGGRLSSLELKRFKETGHLFAGASSDVASWPAEAMVCNCRRVTKGTLDACMATCGRDADALRERTGAGGVCGSCKPLLLELVGQKPVHTPAPYTRALARLAIIAGCFALALWLLPAPQYERSVQASFHAVDRVRLDSTFRKVSGFSAAGLALASLVLSVRKRSRLLSRVSFGGARALHALLGGLALAALLVHTGLRLGSQINFALMTTFLSAALMGAFAGASTAAENASEPRRARAGRRLRNPLSLAHVVLLWPLPLLLGLHILAAYYF